MNTGNFMLEIQDGNSTLTQPNPFDKQQLITESIVRNLIGGCGLPLHITENTAFGEFLKTSNQIMHRRDTKLTLPY